MDVYLINLDRCPERAERIRGLLAPTGLALHRVRALDGRRLRERDRPARSRAGALPAERDVLSRFEIACILGHRSAWRRFLRSPALQAVILEDDVYLVEGFAAFLASPALSSAGFDILKLETYREDVVVDGRESCLVEGRRIAPLLSIHRGSAGYVVTRQAAQRLLALSAGAPWKMDHILFNSERVRRCGFEPFAIGQVVPALVIQRDRREGASEEDTFLASIIAAERGGKSGHERLTGGKILRELARPFRQLWFQSRRSIIEFG